MSAAGPEQSWLVISGLRQCRIRSLGFGFFFGFVRFFDPWPVIQVICPMIAGSSQRVFVDVPVTSLPESRLRPGPRT